jgi:hypothetical protein
MILGGTVTTLPPIESTASATIIAEAITHRDLLDWITSIGILLAGVIGFKTILNVEKIKKIQLTIKIKKLKRDYPIKKLGKTYKIWKYEGKNAVWLIDLNKKIRRHVANIETDHEMGWKDKHESVSEKEIETYPLGDKIDTTSLSS